MINMFVAVVPGYNEAKRIGSVVRDLFNHVDLVIVVDDGSKDNTAQIAREAGAVVLQHRINRGQGASLQTGHEYTLQIGADYVLDFDGDGQFDVLDIQPAMEKIKECKADVLFGSRFLEESSNMPLSKRYLIHPLGKIFNKIFFRVKLSDVHNGFRILNKKALEKIKITQDRMAHATEIPAQVFQSDLKWVEFPVKVLYREYGQSGRGAIQIIKDLIFGKFLK